MYIEGGEKTTEFYNDTNYSYLSQYIQVDRYDNVLSATFSLTGMYRITLYFFCGPFMYFSVLCLLCICGRLFICVLWSPAGKGLASWLSFVVSNCKFVTFPLISWVRCGT